MKKAKSFEAFSFHTQEPHPGQFEAHTGKSPVPTPDGNVMPSRPAVHSVTKAAFVKKIGG